MSLRTLSRTVSIDDFVAGLRRFEEPAFDRTDQVVAYMESTRVTPESLQSYLTWDRQHYTRNLIDRTPLYELMAICWEVGQASSVHNHKDQNCWMAVPIGRLRVENYRVVHQNIDSGECKLETTETMEMNADHPCAVDPNEPVHRVINPLEFNARAVSLHVYSRPFDSCVVYSAEQGTCGEIKLHFNTEFGKPVAVRR